MIHDNQKNNHNGFTMVELLLSMAFISLLLVAIAMLVIQIGNIYSRGVTMKEVNQAGRAITSDLQSSIAQSPRFNPVPAPDGDNYVVQKVSGKVVGARLCLGTYSYIWNNGEAISAVPSTVLNKYKYPAEMDVIRFIKVDDSDSTYCKETGGVYPAIEKDSARELLNVGENDLSIYRFNISSSDKLNDNKIGQRLYNIDFTLGTGVGSLDVSSWLCRPPGDLESDINYCSINDFSLVVRAGDQIE